MKTTLKFDLNELEDIKDHRRCIKALDMACVLFEFQLNSKKKILMLIQEMNNFTDDNGNYKEIIYLSNPKVVDLVFNEFNKLMEEYNINIEELID